MPQLKIIYEATQTEDDMVTTTNGETITLDGCQTFSAQCVVDVDTPANKTFLAAAVTVNPVNTITITAHGYTTGLKVQVSNPGSLPTGISAVTDYFVIVIDANTIKLASSLVFALAGTSISITNIGSGTNTVEVTAIAGANVKLQKSNDGESWTDEGSATNITADANVFLEKASPCFKYMRVVYTLTAGSMSASNLILVKGLN